MVAKAQQWSLGISLSAQQIAILTEDIIWFEEQQITLADGSVRKVIAPRLYVKLQVNALDGSAAILSGQNIDLQIQTVSK